MPKYRERDKVRPIPGAFGLERSKEEWERRNRPNGQYLEGRGVYANHLYIFVEVEYGYASYLWVYPGTVDEFVDDWMCGRIPWGRYDHLGSPSRFKGELDPVTWETTERTRNLPWRERTLELRLLSSGEVFHGFHRREDFDGRVHVHEEEDSYVKIGYYEIRGVREPRKEILVLDALASIR